jgi:hypothetical protein
MLEKVLAVTFQEVRLRNVTSDPISAELGKMEPFLRRHFVRQTLLAGAYERKRRKPR